MFRNNLDAFGYGRDTRRKNGNPGGDNLNHDNLNQDNLNNENSNSIGRNGGNGRRNGGFTLIEVIVVLVILAILAGIAVPALTGYIDKAREKSYIGDARSAKMAIQTSLVEVYSYSSAAGDDQNFAGLDYSDSLNVMDYAPYDYVTVKPEYADTWATMSSVSYDQVLAFSDAHGNLMGLMIFYFSNGSDDSDGLDAVVTYGFDAPAFVEANNGGGTEWSNDEQYHVYTGRQLEAFGDFI
jgi:prepilin-type N-terminal cleavage/methylation domain-containing protein